MKAMDNSNSLTADMNTGIICATNSIVTNAMERANASMTLGFYPVTESITEILMTHLPNDLPYIATDTKS